ncbi:hypothetical protein NU195Hw_g493t1 [Hortaea werneckii]
MKLGSILRSGRCYERPDHRVCEFCNHNHNPVPARFQGCVNRVVQLRLSYMRARDRHPEIRTHEQARAHETIQTRAERLALAARTLDRELRAMEIAAVRRSENVGLPLHRPCSTAEYVDLRNEYGRSTLVPRLRETQAQQPSTRLRIKVSRKYNNWHSVGTMSSLWQRRRLSC